MADDNQQPPVRVHRIGRTTSWSWTWENKGISTRPNPFPTLGKVGGILAIFLSYSIAVRIVGNATVLLLYGWHAYFDQGLRPGEWRRHEAPLLSNGAPLHWAGTLMILFGPMLVTVALALSLEFAASRVRAFLGRQWLWVTALAYLLGATAFVAFAFWPDRPAPGSTFPYLIRFAALIGGIVLLWKAATAPFRNSSS